MSAIGAAALYVGASLLVLFALATAVVRQRIKHKVSLGDGDKPELRRAIRAHANASENIPPVLIALIALALIPNTPVVLIHVIGGLLVFGRLAHGFGLSNFEGRSPGRAAGMITTWTALVIAAISCLWMAFSQVGGAWF